MVKGIIFFEQGGVQPIGDLHSLAGIIDTIEKILPELRQKEAERLLANISEADLEQALEQKKKATVSKLAET